FLAGLADAGKALGHVLDAVVDILLDIRQGRDGFFQGLLDLIQRLHDVLLDILGRRAGVLAQFAQHLAQLARVLGQLIGPDEHQRNDDNDDQLGNSDLHVYTIPFRLLAGAAPASLTALIRPAWAGRSFSAAGQIADTASIA